MCGGPGMSLVEPRHMETTQFVWISLGAYILLMSQWLEVGCSKHVTLKCLKMSSMLGDDAR